MKNFLLAALSAIILTACASNQQEQVSAVSESFLKAWFSDSQQDAMQYCSTALGEMFGAMLEEEEGLQDEHDAEIVGQMLGGTSYTVDSVAIDPEGHIFATAFCTLVIPGEDVPLKKTLDLQKIEKEWKIINIE